ncbi:DUF2508 domain-containing protein, partial [Dysosmobacter welbionis]
DLHIAGLLDGDVGVEALVGHGGFHDLPGVLDLHLDGSLVQAIEIRGFGFDHFVARQRQGLGDGDTIFVRADGIYQLAGPGVINLELRV